MSVTSRVEWTRTYAKDGSFAPGATWSPVTGCTKKSDGCTHCYAKREVDARWSKNPLSVFFGRQFSDVRCHADHLPQPVRWRSGRRIFVCPRSDLFHEDVPFEFMAAVFGGMAIASQHTFLITTKRPERAQAFFDWLHHESGRVPNSSGPTSLCISKLITIGTGLPRRAGAADPATIKWPLPNVHFGVSVEDQPSADIRVLALLRIPAAVRWISAEPLLGAVDLTRVGTGAVKINALTGGWDVPAAAPPYRQEPRIHGVVAGGESGQGARPVHPEWLRRLRDQSHAAGVAFFFKQWGEFAPWEQLVASVATLCARAPEYVFPDPTLTLPRHIFH